MSEHTLANADLPLMSRVGVAPQWLSGDAKFTTCATFLSASTPSSTSLTIAPFAHSPVSLQGVSSRGVDPYPVCRARVEQLLKLQGEQVGLAQTLRTALHIASMHAEPTVGAMTTDGAPQRASAAKSVIDNVENVFPLCRGYRSCSSTRQQRPTVVSTEVGAPSTPKSSSSPSLVPSVMSLVHRLHILQRESAEFAATQCMPSLAELFASFEAYWAWKRSQMCDDGVWEGEGGATPVNGSLAPPHNAIDGATAASQVSQHLPSQQQRPQTLRQRYDQALRVRDELISLLQLHAEAVRALDVQLDQWRQCGDSVPAARSAPGSLTGSPAGTVSTSTAASHDTDAHAHAQRHEFEAYTCQLVEVTQATHHIAQLLKAALQALCRPSPRTIVPSVKPSMTAVRKVEDSSSASEEVRQMDRSAAHSAGVEVRLGRLQSRHTVNTEGLTSSRTSAKCDRAYSSIELSGTASSSPAVHTGDTVTRSECSLHSSLHPDARTPRQCAKLTQCGGARLVSGAADDAHDSWADALSPLTPPPASVSPPSPSPRRVECSEPHGQPLRRQRHSQRGPLPSLLSLPGAAGQAERSGSLVAASCASLRCASPSSTGAISLSPVTVQCSAATSAAAVVPAQSGEDSIGMEQQRPEPMPSFTSHPGRSGERGVDSGFEAAVTPIVTVRLTVDGAATHDGDGDEASHWGADTEHPSWPRGNCLSQDGARLLLPELTSASADAVAGEGSRLCKGPQSAGSGGRDVRGGPVAVDNALRIFGKAAPVCVPSLSERPSCHSGDAPVLATVPEFADMAKREEGRTNWKPSPSLSISPQHTSEAHSAATRASVSCNRSASLQYLSPRSPSIVGVAGRSTACDECGRADEQGCRSVGRAASIPTCLWPQLHDRAASPPLSSSSAVPVLTSTDVAEEGQPVHSTAAPVFVPDRPSSKEREGSHETTITHSVSRTADVNVNTARDSGTDASPPPAVAATFRVSTSSAQSEPSSRLLQQIQHPMQPQGHQERHVREWNHAVSSTPLLLDNFESELAKVQQRLQDLAPPRHSSSVLSASSAAADDHATAEALRHSLENRVRHTMHEELKSLRAEQRHSLRKMRKYVKHRLEEVAEAVSAVSSRNQSSRGSSCVTAHEGNDNGADSQGRDASPTMTAGKQRRAARASREVQTEGLTAAAETARAPASNPAINSAARPSSRSITEQQHTAPAVPASPKAHELQRSLADAEAKAARLEQLTVQLKKRLWMAEWSQRSPVSETRLPRRPAAAAKRHLSLRDAFVYGLSSEAGDTEEDDGDWSKARYAAARDGCSEDDSAAADGVAVEERAMLYFVDRELGRRTAWDAHTQSHHRPSPLLHPTSEISCSSRQVSCHGSLSSSSMERERSPEMRCFEDDSAASFLPAIISAPAGATRGLPSPRLDSSSAAPVSATSIANATRSPSIRGQRASIFQLLRQSQSAWDAQSSAPTGQQQQQQSDGSQPSPSQSQQHNPAGTVAEGLAVLTPQAQSAERSSPRRQTQRLGRHPYNADGAPHGDSRNTKRVTTDDLRPSVCSHYYAAISGGNGSVTGSVAGARSRSPASAGTLHVEQVLQNAKRLLQCRSASLATGHHDIRGPQPSSPPLAGGLPSSFSAVSSAKTRADSREHCLETRHHHRGGATGGTSASPVGHFSRPRQWGDRVGQLNGTSLPQRAFADADPHSGITDAALGLRRASDSQDRRTGGSVTAGRARESRSHSQSPESGYHGYDTSPCSAVAYSTGKLPRSSSPPDTNDAPSSTGHRPTPLSPTAGPPLLVDVSRAATSATARHARHRVDSATSPVCREDAHAWAAADRRERGSSSHSDVAVHHRERSARSITISTECDCSPPETGATGTRGTRGDRSPSLLHPGAERCLHDGKREVSVPLISRLGHSTSQCHACSKSSTSSCDSAQQQLLGTLEEQESTLGAALDQLQVQQRQLREKHQQVLLLAKRKALVGAVHAPSRMTRDDCQRAGDRDRNGSMGAGEKFQSSTYLHHLLKRLKAAESSLAEREQRVRQALRVVQRQRSALLRDDLL